MLSYKLVFVLEMVGGKLSFLGKAWQLLRWAVHVVLEILRALAVRLHACQLLSGVLGSGTTYLGGHPEVRGEDRVCVARMLSGASSVLLAACRQHQRNPEVRRQLCVVRVCRNGCSMRAQALHSPTP
jgi:hypothetical protein